MPEPRRGRTPSACSRSSTSTASQATFFVLGWVARAFPALVRDDRRARATRSRRTATASAGLRPDAGRRSATTCRRAKRSIEDHVGTAPCVGYRAPSFSITPRSLWALDVLVEEGYAYDASIFPIRHDRYGIPDAPRHPHGSTAAAGR